MLQVYLPQCAVDRTIASFHALILKTDSHLNEGLLAKRTICRSMYHNSLAVDHEGDDHTRAGAERRPAEQVEAAPQLRAKPEEPLFMVRSFAPNEGASDARVKCLLRDKRRGAGVRNEWGLGQHTSAAGTR